MIPGAGFLVALAGAVLLGACGRAADEVAPGAVNPALIEYAGSATITMDGVTTTHAKSGTGLKAPCRSSATTITIELTDYLNGVYLALRKEEWPLTGVASTATFSLESTLDLQLHQTSSKFSYFAGGTENCSFTGTWATGGVSIDYACTGLTAEGGASANVTGTITCSGIYSY